MIIIIGFKCSVSYITTSNLENVLFQYQNHALSYQSSLIKQKLMSTNLTYLHFCSCHSPANHFGQAFLSLFSSIFGHFKVFLSYVKLWKTFPHTIIISNTRNRRRHRNSKVQDQWGDPFLNDRAKAYFPICFEADTIQTD